MREIKSICLSWKAILSFLMLPVLAILGVFMAGVFGIICGVTIGGGLIGCVLCDLEKKNVDEAAGTHSIGDCRP